MIHFDLASEIQKLAENTKFKVVKSIKRYKINTSTDETVLIDIDILNECSFRITFDYRSSLKFQDQGAGNGWKQGIRINQNSYTAALSDKKTRRPQKRLINRKIFWMINSLKEVGTTNIIEQTISSFTVNLTTQNVSTNREN